MSKLYKDLARSITNEFDFRRDYRLPERLNGKTMDEIRDFAVEYINRMPNSIVIFAEKPYGKGAAYFYNHENPESTNEVVFACSEDLRLNIQEICKYMTFDVKKRGMRAFIFIGENGAYSQLPLVKLRRLMAEGDEERYEDGKLLSELVAEGYFASFTEEGYMPAFAEMTKAAAEKKAEE